MMGRADSTGLPGAAVLRSFMDDGELERLLPHSAQGELSPGELLFEAGEEGEFMAFVLEGRLAVRAPALFPGRSVLLAEVEPGGMVGEGAVFSSRPHAVSVAAVERSRLLLLDRKSLQALAKEDKDLSMKVMTWAIQALQLRLHGADRRLVQIL